MWYNTNGSVIISLEEVDGINDKLKEIIYQTQKSVDEDELTFKQSIAKSKECYVLLRVVRKIAKKKDCLLYTSSDLDDNKLDIPYF